MMFTETLQPEGPGPPGRLTSARPAVDDIEDVSSKMPGVGWRPDKMVRRGDPGVVTRVRPGAHGGAGRGAQISAGGA